jgi:hypothetical protein
VADVLIRRTQAGDAQILAENMRASDAAEVHAYGHFDLEWAVEQSVAQSLLCWTAFIDGELAAILGCAPISIVSGIGSPWMLGTPVLDAHARVLVRATPRYIAEMLKAFPHLVNHVHTHNTTSKRWLRRIGFTLREAAPFGALGEPFHRFEMKA